MNLQALRPEIPLFLALILLLGACGASAQSDSSTSLKRFYLPEKLPARMVFELRSSEDSAVQSQIWLMRREGKHVVTERMDLRNRLLEYLKEDIGERGARAESFSTYVRDSAGRSTPLFAEIGSRDLFFWPWEAGQKAVFSYLEPRRLDSRMNAIRVERERILLADQDSTVFGGRTLALRHISDLVRLVFLDRAGQVIGEDVFLEFHQYAEGLGLISSTRQFADGKTLFLRRQED